MGGFGFGFGDPGIGGNGNPSSNADWLSTAFKFAQLGTQTYLAQDALNSTRPATLVYSANGTPIATGGGASPIVSPLSAGLSSGVLWLVAIAVVVLLLLRR